MKRSGTTFHFFYTVTGTWTSAAKARAAYRTVHSRRNALVISR